MLFSESHARPSDAKVVCAVSPSSRLQVLSNGGRENGVATESATDATLSEFAESAVRRYLDDLDGTQCSDLHRLFLQQVEMPLLREVVKHCDGNLSHAAQILGINRATLRKRMAEYRLS
ncbi:MAG: Fis family transcriptional regulator [Xanthomonadales bacterium]|nr:Fis family transcriptional regulator [Xanthomonadales bacterium]